MQIIPVIDVRHGVAVAAVRGERASYRPLHTPLAAGSDPVDVARGYCRLFPFPRIYLADLDGIEGRGRNPDLSRQMHAALPDVQLWVDDGASAAEAAQRIAKESPVMLVLGSESLAGAEDVSVLRALARDRYVLSLDFRGDGFIGPTGVLAEPEHWPDNVVVMTLARVGASEGPDLARVGQIVAAAGRRQVYAAGGVRDVADVEALRSAGVSGILLATALHAQKIEAGDLQKIAGL